jgi:hypothetical protein
MTNVEAKLFFSCKFYDCGKWKSHWAIYRGSITEDDNNLLEIVKLGDKWNPDIIPTDGREEPLKARELILNHFVDTYIRRWEVGDPLKMKMKKKFAAFSRLTKEVMNKWVQTEFTHVFVDNTYDGGDFEDGDWGLYLEKLQELVKANHAELPPELAKSMTRYFRRALPDSSSSSSKEEEDGNGASESNSNSEESEEDSSSSRSQSPKRK